MIGKHHHDVVRELVVCGSRRGEEGRWMEKEREEGRGKERGGGGFRERGGKRGRRGKWESRHNEAEGGKGDRSTVKVDDLSCTAPLPR